MARPVADRKKVITIWNVLESSIFFSFYRLKVQQGFEGSFLLVEEVYWDGYWVYLIDLHTLIKPGFHFASLGGGLSFSLRKEVESDIWWDSADWVVLFFRHLLSLHPVLRDYVLEGAWGGPQLWLRIFVSPQYIYIYIYIYTSIYIYIRVYIYIYIYIYIRVYIYIYIWHKTVLQRLWEWNYSEVYYIESLP